eukprot:SAG31_NODE_2905_length_4925_cov_85.303357_2_plen_118_part_00
MPRYENVVREHDVDGEVLPHVDMGNLKTGEMMSHTINPALRLDHARKRLLKKKVKRRENVVLTPLMLTQFAEMGIASFAHRRRIVLAICGEETLHDAGWTVAGTTSAGKGQGKGKHA